MISRGTTAAVLIILATLVLSSMPVVSGHGTVDQSFAGPFPFLVRPGPQGQSFTPTASNLVAVDLVLCGPRGVTDTLTAHIRQLGFPDLLGGPVLGSTRLTLLAEGCTFAVDPDGTRVLFAQIIHFDFSSPIPLTPGNLYVIQFQPPLGWAWAANPNDLYTRGNGIFDNFFHRGLDFGFTTYFAVTEEPTIEKQLLEGPQEIGISLLSPTQYIFEIAYANPNPSTPVRITDTVPAEFEILSLSPSDGTASFFDPSKGKANSANRIVWDLPVGTATATLTVEIQTVQSPGHTKAPVFKPTSCGPLPINDGATAFEVDPETGEIVEVEVVDPVTGEVTLEPVVIVGPSNALVVEAVEGAKPCIEG